VLKFGKMNNLEVIAYQWHPGFHFGPSSMMQLGEIQSYQWFADKPYFDQTSGCHGNIVLRRSITITHTTAGI